MTNRWTQYLQDQGARFDDTGDQLLGFDAQTPASATSEAARLVPLLGQGILELIGPEAEKFLQGQLTCDLRRVSDQRSTLGSYCTPKGNVVSSFRLLARPQGFWLRMDRSLLETTRTTLGKYIVFSKAELKDTQDALVGIGLIGKPAEPLLQGLFGQVPQTVNAALALEAGILVRVPGAEPRFELWLSLEAAEQLWPQLASQATPCATATWTQADINAGIPLLAADSSDLYIPQMLNLQALDAISFDKGCYTGQEVVARMQYRGKLKRVLRHAQVQSPFPPQPGMALHSPRRKSIGQVIACTPLGDQSHLVQVVVSKEIAEQEPLHLETQEGPELQLQPLPYELDPSLFER